MLQTTKSADFISENLPALQVTYQAPKGKINVHEPGNPEKIFRTILKDDAFIQQHLYVLFIGANGCLLSWKLISTGSMNSILINLKMILAIALQLMACEIMIAHTRPQFDDTLEDTNVHQFILEFGKHADFIGITLSGYYILDDLHCLDAFEYLSIQPKWAKDIILH